MCYPVKKPVAWYLLVIAREPDPGEVSAMNIKILKLDIFCVVQINMTFVDANFDILTAVNVTMY